MNHHTVSLSQILIVGESVACPDVEYFLIETDISAQPGISATASATYGGQTEKDQRDSKDDAL